MAVKRVVVHAGMHKTGTSFIQNTLYENREHLAELGVLYPTSGLHRRSPNAGLRHLGLKTSLDHEGDHSFALAELGTELATSECHTAIVSYEGLLAPDVDLGVLAGAFGPYELSVVVYLRHPVDYLESKYREWVRLNAFAGEIDRFHDAHEAFLDPGALIDRASSELGNPECVVRSIESLAGPGDLLSDFLSAAGVDVGADQLTPTETGNAGSTNGYTLAKLMANKVFLTGEFDVRTIVDRHAFDYGSNEGRLVDDELLERILDRHAGPYSELLRTHGFVPESISTKWVDRPRDDAFFSDDTRRLAVDHLRVVLESRDEARREKRRQARATEREHARARDQLERARAELEKVDAVRERLQTDLAERTAQLEDATDELNVTRERLTESSASLASVSKDLAKQRRLATDRTHELRRAQRKLELMRFWKPANWRRYPGIVWRRVRLRRTPAEPAQPSTGRN